MTRIGVIGCGMWGRNLARNLAQLGVLGGGADLVPEHAKSFATEFNVPAMDVATLIEGAGLDGVVIATAAPTHREIACRVLAAGSHVFVEKPLALSLDDAEAIAARLQAEADAEQLRTLAKQLLQAWHLQKAATSWVIRQQDDAS